MQLGKVHARIVGGDCYKGLHSAEGPTKHLQVGLMRLPAVLPEDRRLLRLYKCKVLGQAPRTPGQTTFALQFYPRSSKLSLRRQRQQALI